MIKLETKDKGAVRQNLLRGKSIITRPQASASSQDVTLENEKDKQ